MFMTLIQVPKNSLFESNLALMKISQSSMPVIKFKKVEKDAKKSYESVQDS